MVAVPGREMIFSAANSIGKRRSTAEGRPSTWRANTLELPGSSAILVAQADDFRQIGVPPLLLRRAPESGRLFLGEA